MSNNDDWRNPDFDLEQYDRNYNSNMKKLKAQNAEREAAQAKWQADQSPEKPPYEFAVGKPPMSQEEMEKKADTMAREQMRQTEVMERDGLLEPKREDREQEQAPRNSFEAFFGRDNKEAERQARDDQERQAEENRLQKERERKRGDEGRNHD